MCVTATHLRALRSQPAVGSADSNDGQQFQIVVANILAHILIAIMADLKETVAADGLLILSGIIAEQETEMLTALEMHELEITERHVDGDWVAFVVRAASLKN